MKRSLIAHCSTILLILCIISLSVLPFSYSETYAETHDYYGFTLDTDTGEFHLQVDTRDYTGVGSSYPRWVMNINGIDIATLIKTLYVDEGVSYIGNYAFGYMANQNFNKMKNLQTAYLPESLELVKKDGLTWVKSDVFVYGEKTIFELGALKKDVTIHCYPGSTAEIFAKNNGNPIVLMCKHVLTTEGHIPATCTEEGFSGNNVCTLCGEIVEPGTSLKALGHDITEVKEVPATCEEDGTKAHYACNRCEKLFQDAEGKQEITDESTLVIPATDHEWDEGVVTTKPTYDKEGVKTFTCKHNASHTRMEVIPKLARENIAKATISGNAARTYNGNAQTQAPAVKMNVGGTDVTLKNGTDYTLSYKNNVNAGTATVVITGKGAYEGSVSKTFKINPASIAKATVTGINASYTETGKAIAPNPVVKLAIGGKTVTLKKDTDYTVKYANNVKAGTATVTITGKGNYTGTVKKTFKINAKAKSDTRVKLDGITAAKHEIGKVTFVWSKKSGSTGNWTIQYRWRKIGGNNSWTGWKTQTFKAGVLQTTINVPRNYCIEIRGKGSGDTAWSKSIFTTPAGGKYQSMKYVHVKNVATNKRVTSITLKKGQAVKLRPDYDYPVKNYTQRPRLYPNHMFYDDANTSIISIRNDAKKKAYDGTMVDGTVTVKGLKAGTTTITCRAPNGRTMKLKVTVK